MRVESDRARLSLLEFANVKNTGAISRKICRGLTEFVLAVVSTAAKSV